MEVTQQQWRLFLMKFVKVYGSRPETPETPETRAQALVEYTKRMVFECFLDPSEGLFSLLTTLPKCSRYFFDGMSLGASEMINVFIFAGADTENIIYRLMLPVYFVIIKLNKLNGPYDFQKYIEGFDVIGWLFCWFKKHGYIKMYPCWWNTVDAEYWEHLCDWKTFTPPKDGYIKACRQYMKYCILMNEQNTHYT